MATGQRKDPYGNFNFHIELGGVTYGIFTEVSGFDSTVDVIEYREGGESTTLRKLPGLTKYSNIVLKWGLTDDLALYDWHHQAVLGNIERKNGSIVALNHQGDEVTRWNFVNAWPTKYDGPDYNAEGTDVAIETLELAHEGVERVK